MRPEEYSTDPLWEVAMEQLKDYMYCYKGQTMNEVVQASDKDIAIIKALSHNEMGQQQVDDETVKILGVRQWTYDEQGL